MKIRKNKIIALLLVAGLSIGALSGCKALDKAVEEAEDKVTDVTLEEEGEINLNLEAAQNGVQEEKEEIDPLTIELPEPEYDPGENNEDLVFDDGRKQIVFMGDSVFDMARDGTGVPYLTAEQLDFNVVNLAIGGSRATIEQDEEPEVENWTSKSLNGLIFYMQGKVGIELFEGTNAKSRLEDKTIDWSKTDYFVIEYGINDFLSHTPLDDESSRYNVKTYVGALRLAIDHLKEVAPDAQIILCTPHYIEIYGAGGVLIGDANMLHNGYGTLFDYAGKVQYMAGEQEVWCFDAFRELDLSSVNIANYSDDGIHLNEAGRKRYADLLAEFIRGIEEERNANEAQ